MKNINNTWKRIAAGALSLALVAGAMPANVGGFLTGGNGIVAHAEDHAKNDLVALTESVNTWLATSTEDQITQEPTTNDSILHQTDINTYNALQNALPIAGTVSNADNPAQNDINQAYDMLSSAYNDAKRAVNATPITGENFLALAVNGAITLDKDYLITEPLIISLPELDLNLNGHALYMGDRYLVVSPEATLTVEDSSETGTGLLVGNVNVLNNIGTVTIDGGTIKGEIYNNGTVTIDGGTIKGNIHNTGSPNEGDPDVTMNIKSGVIVGQIFNSNASAKLNISGGEIRLNQSHFNDGGTVTVTGGKFNFNPTDYLADGYKAIKDEVNNIYEVIMPFSVKTDDSIYEGCEINLYAKADEKFETTVTVTSDAVFEATDALELLGIASNTIEVKNYEYNNEGQIINPETAPTFATVAVTNGDVTQNGDNYELAIKFTVTPKNTAEAEEDPVYLTGSGTVTIGGMTINVNVANPVAESEKAEIAASGLTALSFTYNENNEEVTESYTKRQLSSIGGVIRIPAGATVTLTTQYKSEFSYNDGFKKKIAGLTETDGNNRAYTYSFTMPGYNVDHSFVEYRFTDDTLYDNDNDASTEDVTSITERTGCDDNDNEVYYYGKDVTIKSANRLVFTDDNDKLIEFTETKNESDYTYTFKVTSNVTASLYEHKHDYTYKVEDNQLIRTCKLKDDYCGEGNSDTPIAELELVTDFPEGASSYVYDGTAKSVTVNGSLINGVTVTAGTTEYFKADAFGDAISDALTDGAPKNAGMYLATNTVWYDIDGDNIKDEDEEFELSINFEIKPKNINDESINFDVTNTTFDNEVYKLNDTPVYANPQPKLHDNSDDINTDLLKGIDGDYVITGASSATKPGTYTAEVNGVGNYTGTREYTWQYGNVEAAHTELTENMIYVRTAYRNGYAEATVLVFKDLDNLTQFTEGTNYYILGETAVNAGGTYKLKVVGIDSTGLSGTVEIDWVVDEVQLSGKNADMKKVTYLESDNRKLEFRANMAVPEGATMTKIGVFATDNEEFKYKLNFTDTPKQTDDVFVKEYTDDLADKKTSSYTWRKKNVQRGATWYAVPYVCYTDKYGIAVTAYGDLIKATVDDNGKATYEKVEIGQAKFKSASYNATTKKLEFANRMIIPEGCTMQAIGICATTNQAKSADLSLNTAAVNGETYIKAYTDDLEGKTASNYTWRKTSVKAGDTWYVKPYVTYTDADGATYTAYGALETVTAGQEAAANAELS